MNDNMAPLAHRVSRLQNRIVWELNDIHIFVRQAMPLLQEAKASRAASTHKKDRRYYVPSVKRVKFARRTDKELKAIYEAFTTRRLYEAFLITAIGEFEGFLANVLREVFRDYPRKLGVSTSGIAACRTAALECVLTSTTVDEVLQRTIDEHLRGVFFAAPRAYLDYVSKVVGTSLDDPTFLEYYEMKATRDLLVHTDRTANSIYVAKAGEMARGNVGDVISVDSDYFDTSLATLKRIAGIVKRDVVKAFSVEAPAA